MLFHIIDDAVVLLSAALSCDNPEKQVRSVKPCHHSNRIVKSKRSHYIIFHALRSGRSKCAHYRSSGKSRQKSGYFQIARPEILSPLRYTVCLIDRQHRYVRVAGEIQKTRCVKALRSDIDYLVAPL